MKYSILTTFVVAIFFSISHAQQLASDTLKRKPKIALVLSGGGAKGLAHIGVLKVLEEVGIVPDIITGTSMGSIIGGLYAIGYTSQELSRINHTIPWSEYLTNTIPLNKTDMIRKSEYERYPLEFPIIGSKIYLPSGIIESQNFWKLFHNLAWPALGIQSFDSLPIPFRCVATEIMQGKQKTFNQGSLPIAMRASMAIPGVFSPVIIGDTLIYVDGGVCKNFPVDEAIEMGADIIIGVYVGTVQELDPSKAKTIDKILMQTAFFTGLKESREVMGKCHILIIPNLNGLGAQSFEKGKEIEQRGYETAKNHYKELKSLADSLNKIRLGRVNPKIKVEAYHISDIQILGTKNLAPQFIIAKSKLQPGDSVTIETMNQAIENIFATLYFERIAYYFKPSSDNKYTLVIDVQEKEPKLLKANIHVNNFWGPAITMNYHHNNLLSKTGQFNTKLEVSRIPRINVIHSQYWGKKQNFSTSSKLFFESDEIPIYIKTHKVGTINENYFGISADAGYIISNTAYVSLGSSFAITSLHTSSSFRIVFPEESISKAHFGGLKLFGEYAKNSLDRTDFPRQGSRTTVNISLGISPWLKIKHRPDASLLDSVPAPGNYIKFVSGYEFNFSPINRLTCMLGADFRFVTGKAPAFDYLFIGGFDDINRSRDLSFYGLGYRQINLPNLYILKSEVRLKVWKELYGLGRINYLQGTEKIANILFDTFKPEFDIFGYGIGLGYKALIGPVNFWVSGNAKYKNTWVYFSLGHTF